MINTDVVCVTTGLNGRAVPTGASKRVNARARGNSPRQSAVPQVFHKMAGQVRAVIP